MDDPKQRVEQVLPVACLHDDLVFPGEVRTLVVEHPGVRAAFDFDPAPDGRVLLAFAEDGRAGAGVGDCLDVAVEARVLDRVHLDDDTLSVVVQGLRRVRLGAPAAEGPGCAYEPVEAPAEARRPTLKAKQLTGLYERLIEATDRHPKSLLGVLRSNLHDLERLPDLLGAGLQVAYGLKLPLVEAQTLAERFDAALNLLRGEFDRIKVGKEVDKKTKREIDESRREYYLRQQMKTIRKELKEDHLSQREADVYSEQLDLLGLPDGIAREARREIERLRHIQPSSSEYQVIKTFLDRFFQLPWGKYDEEQIDLPRVQQALDEGHHALDKVKARILEFLAVRKLNPGHKGPILCFAGPPGVGKTSLGRAIADAVGRAFYRISVGGVRDEAEIRGHRRTYVGALPGKILSGLTRAGCMNPLLMLDEIDKIGSDHRGDPAAALLEVLDPEQNDTFTDHYFNVPFDLSKVLFIVTANYLHDIPRPLLDRLEVISIEGYTESEKLHIARQHLVPKVLAEHGLSEVPPTIEEGAVRAVVQRWTREAGVRGLQRALQKLARKVARRRVEAGETAAIIVGAEDVPEFLGPPKYSHDEGVDSDQIGAANGLAWTASGGEILVIEALKMPGKGKLIITGKLGEVMKESVQAAYSFTRSRAEALGLEAGELDALDLHIHFPAGAVPKDGPSAGVTVTLALASLLSGRAVRADFAMTGEVTLRGKVLAVGGVKGKLLAAYRAGITHVALPKANEKDLTEVPAEVRAAITFHALEHVDELLALALRPGPEPLPLPRPADAPLHAEL